MPAQDELEIAEDIRLQERLWRFERLGGRVLAALVALAALGLFGPGVLGPVRAATADGGLRVEYLRFARMDSPLRLRVRLLLDEATSGGEVRLWLSASYLDRMALTGITPAPEHVELGSGRTTFVFSRDESHGPAEVTFSLEAPRPGGVQGQVGRGQDALDLHHFIYP